MGRNFKRFFTILAVESLRFTEIYAAAYLIQFFVPDLRSLIRVFLFFHEFVHPFFYFSSRGRSIARAF